MSLIEPLDFIQKLSELYASNSSGVIRVSFKKFYGEEIARQKRKTLTESTDKVKSFSLVRAIPSRGKKFSTKISESDVQEFQAKVNSVIRNYLLSLVRKSVDE
jgi:Signal recognition particle 14kD protein